MWALLGLLAALLVFHLPFVSPPCLVGSGFWLELCLEDLFSERIAVLRGMEYLYSATFRLRL